MKANKKRYVVVRTYSAGCFVGWLEERKGKEVRLSKARRLWKWSGASCLSQIALEGVRNPNGCRFSGEVNQKVTEAIEIIDVTEAARKNIASVPVWK